MSNKYDNTIIGVIFWGIVLVAVVAYLRRRGFRRTAFGTAEWASDKLLRAWQMLAAQGLILGRTISGAMIRMPHYCHILLIGSTGSGKGVSIIIPNLLSYIRGSLVVFDTKGDLFKTTAQRRRQLGQRVVRLAPFAAGGDTWNVLDTIPPDNNPLLIDSAKAMAESLVVRLGTESEPHWNDKAAEVIGALLTLILIRMTGKERSLNSVQDIASNTEYLLGAAEKLREMGGVPARMGGKLKMYFDKDGLLTKEGTGVLSTVGRHLSFLDSEMVSKSVATSTFDVHCLSEAGTTLFLTIPPDQLEAQRGLLRVWISTLIRVIGSSGHEENSEVLFLIDEASALGSLSAVEEALVRGRSAGCRLLLAYQSDSQVQTAFKDKSTLLYDNCSTQIYLGASSLETAERISKSLGDWTQIVESDGDNWGQSTSGGSGGNGSRSWSWGGSTNRAQQGRALLRPEEILTLGDEYLIAFIRGLPAPVLAKRVKWYEDAAFNAGARKRRQYSTGFIVWLVLLAALTLAMGFLIVRAKVNGYGYWTPETEREVNDGKVR